MPVTLFYKEKGIYCSKWSGTVTFDEIFQTQSLGNAQVDEDGVSHYVLVLEFSEKPRLPIDIRQTGRLIAGDERMVAILMVAASDAMKLLGSTLTRVFKHVNPIEYFDTFEDALTRARELVTSASATEGNH